MTQRLHFHFSLSRIREGNGIPLQCSCLENPRDGGAWWLLPYMGSHRVGHDWSDLAAAAATKELSDYVPKLLHPLHYLFIYFYYLPWCLRQKRIHLQFKRPGFDLWVRKIPWRREWWPTPIFLIGEFYGQRSLAGYSLWGHKESDTTEQLTLYIIFNAWLVSKAFVLMYAIYYIFAVLKMFE